MRNRYILPAFVCLATYMALPAFANDGGVRPAISPQEAAQFRNDLHAVAKAMGADVPAPTTNQPAPATPPKTMPEVADKALDMVNGLVASISTTLQNIAPMVWEIMVRQQYAKAVAALIVPFGCLFSLLFLWLCTRKIWKLGADSPDYEKVAHLWLVKILPLTLACFGLVWAADRLADSIQYLINPQYYAVRDILVMVLNPGGIQ